LVSFNYFLVKKNPRSGITERGFLAHVESSHLAHTTTPANICIGSPTNMFELIVSESTHKKSVTTISIIVNDTKDIQ